MPPREFSFGDRLLHAAKPEWGVGHVVAAQNVHQNGAPCQRLQVRFERAGLKTLSTAVADLRPAAEPAAVSTAEPPGPSAELDENPQAVMARMPEAATDPFSSPARRLEATLDLYKYRPEGASLLDWAARQSGLKDPLERFSRHELEAFYDRFHVALDRHLEKVVREVRTQDPGAVDRVAALATPEARAALKRLHARR